jgi:hypothetical protein
MQIRFAVVAALVLSGMGAAALSRFAKQDRLIHALEARAAAQESAPRVLYQLNPPAPLPASDEARPPPRAPEASGSSAEGSASDGAPSNEPSQESAANAAREQDAKEAAAAQMATFNTVLGAFRSQPVDAAWSARAGRNIEFVAGPRLGNVRRGDVECRSSWCSLEVTLPAGTDNQPLMRTLFTSSAELEGRPAPMMYGYPREDGTWVYRYYFRYGSNAR